MFGNQGSHSVPPKRVKQWLLIAAGLLALTAGLVVVTNDIISLLQDNSKKLAQVSKSTRSTVKDLGAKENTMSSMLANEIDTLSELNPSFGWFRRSNDALNSAKLLIAKEPLKAVGKLTETLPIIEEEFALPIEAPRSKPEDIAYTKMRRAIDRKNLIARVLENRAVCYAQLHQTRASLADIDEAIELTDNVPMKISLHEARARVLEALHKTKEIAINAAEISKLRKLPQN